MGTRKVKDAKLNGEKIYYRGHAKATYMSDGKSVEDSINELAEKQEKSISEINIKTINGMSILGNGNIVIENEPVGKEAIYDLFGLPVS